MPDPLTAEWFIYALVDPRTDAVRYIGKAANLRVRLSAHLRDRASTRKARWLRTLIREGLRPTLITLEQGAGDWRPAEQRWIAKFKADGANLTNATLGGEGLLGATTETRRKIGEAQRLRWSGPGRARALELARSPEKSAAISAALRGKVKTAEHMAKLPQNQRGYEWSHAVREQRRAALEAYARPAAITAARSAAQLAHLRDMAEANQGRPGWARGRVLSQEERVTRSAALKGKPKTPEHREKIRQAAQRRWAQARGEEVTQ